MSDAFFGSRQVNSGEKTSLVKGVFSSVASRYDLMNNLMSLGVHHVWKRDFVSQIEKPHAAIIDMAGGTGDITNLCYERAVGAGEAPNITLCDINESMLEQARDRFINGGKIKGITIQVVNAEEIPFPDKSFDYYTIAFGLRNVTYIDKALREAYRVLKPGGKFLCLEFSRVTSPILSGVYDFYSELLPMLGKVVAQDEEAYRYLVESIRRFPTQKQLVTRIESAGFRHVGYRNMTGGVVAIHSGWRIDV